MIIYSNDSSDFESIAKLLGDDPDASNLELIGGLDCDQEDRDLQREFGDTDPIATIELIAQCSLDQECGIIDWFFARESTADQEEPNIEHGGALLAFRKGDQSLDFDETLPYALAELNKVIKWANFELEE